MNADNLCRWMAAASFALTTLSPTVVNADGDHCRRVRAEFMNTIVSDGCASPVGLCTAGLVTGSGLLKGANTFTASGLAAAAGLAGIEPETLVSFAGERVITTPRGTLTLHAAGVFDTAPTAAGEFSELEKVVGGTGRFAGATGTLHLFGQATADGAGFQGAIVGEICRMEEP